MKRVWTKAIMVLASLAFTASAGATSLGESPDKRVEIIDLKIEQSIPYGTIKGEIINHSTKVVKAIVVKFNLYDERHVLVGNTAAITQNLGPGETWSFSAPATAKFLTAKVSEIQAYDVN